MNYRVYILSVFLALALSTSIEANELSNTDLGRAYFEFDWSNDADKKWQRPSQKDRQENWLKDVAVNYFNSNQTICTSCIELVADLNGYKLILIREKHDD